MKYSGTISRGVRTPIIKMGDDLASIVVDSVGRCIEEANIQLQDKDVIAITEAVVGISEGNYATTSQLSSYAKTTDVETMISDAIGSAIGGSY